MKSFLVLLLSACSTFATVGCGGAQDTAEEESPSGDATTTDAGDEDTSETMPGESGILDE